MKKACIAMLVILIASIAAMAQEEAPDEIKELQRRHRDLRDEVNRLHLLNLLDMSLEQAQQLKALLDNLKLARELLNQQAVSGQKEMVDVLQEIRDKLAQGAEEPPQELVEKYNEIRRKSNEATKSFFEKLKEADKELNGLLTEEQGKVLENYEGDVLQPKKAGPQGRESRLAQVAKLLDRVVKMNNEQLEQAKEKIFGQFIGRLAKDRSVPRQHIQSVRRKLDEIINSARKMDELEYMLWREEYAKQLLELGSPPKRSAAGRAGRKQKGPELSKVATVLLDEGMLKALESKIEAMKKEKPAEGQEEEKEPSED